jgi:hypothetical protein
MVADLLASTVAMAGKVRDMEAMSSVHLWSVWFEAIIFSLLTFLFGLWNGVN